MYNLLVNHLDGNIFLLFLSSNQVMDAYCRFLQHEDSGETKLFISPYIVVSINNQSMFLHDGYIIVL